MTPLEIKIAILRAGLSIADIGRQTNVGRSHVSSVISGRLTTPHVRRAVSDALAMTYLQVWGVEDPKVDRLQPGRKCLTAVNVSGERGAA